MADNWRDNSFEDQGYRGHRGRGNRGFRGRGYGNRNFCDQESRTYPQYDGRDPSPSNRNYDRGGRGKRPPHLRGRDIGMWYATRGRAKQVRLEKEERPTVLIDCHEEQKIRSMLNKFDSLQDAEQSEQLKVTLQSSQNNKMGVKETHTVSYTGNLKTNKPKYKNKKARREELLEKEIRPTVDLDSPVKNKIRSVLNTLKGEEGVSQSRNPSTKSNHSLVKNESPSVPVEDWFQDRKGACIVTKGEYYYKNADFDKMKATFLSEEKVVQIDEEDGDEDEDVIMIDTDDSDVEIIEDDEVEVEGVEESFKEFMEVIKFEDLDVTPVIVSDSDSEVPVTNFVSNRELDKKYKRELEQKSQNGGYRNMLKFRKKLPSYSMHDEIVKTILDNHVVVVSGETGCGKTTQIPQFILDMAIQQGNGSRCHVICTQPRRISAISVAERVSQERAVKCGGEEVGYMIRLESRLPRPRGSILFCTTGCVLKFLESDPRLERATHIIIDEIHERDLQSDFLMIILKDLLPKRPDLKILLMSATLNAEKFSEYFDNCPMLHIPGFTYPVEEIYLEDIVEMLAYKPEPSRFRPKRLHGEKRKLQEEKRQRKESWVQSLRGSYSNTTINSLMLMDDDEVDLNLVSNLISNIVLTKPPGALLVFVPGWAEISALNKRLLDQPMLNNNSFRIIPLHSLMPTVNQKQVFERPPPGVRKIIIATNIAETSITIDDIVYVIDTGKIKLQDFEPENNISTLESKPVSLANAKQRRGRAGRVQAGVCYRLFTRQAENEMIDYFPPEMLRTRLESICLQIKMLKLGPILPFVSKAMEPPSISSLNRAINTLQDLNAIDDNEELMPLGFHLAKMPVDPHTGKMILFGAMFGCLDPILTVAASLGFKTAFFTPLGKEGDADRARVQLSKETNSDHILLINAMRDWEIAKANGYEYQFCRENFLSANILKLLREMKGQLARLLQELRFTSSSSPLDDAANINSENLSLIKAIICAGLYPNVAKIGKIPKRFARQNQTVKLQLKDGQRAAMHPVSVNARQVEFKHKWVIFHKMLKTSNIYVHDCTTISPYPLLLFGGDISLLQDEGHCVSVDDWIIFKCSPNTAGLVKDLRGQLDKLLEEKITCPGPTDWSRGSKEGTLMRLILDLVCKDEDKQRSS